MRVGARHSVFGDSGERNSYDSGSAFSDTARTTFTIAIAGLGISFSINNIALADKARVLYEHFITDYESSMDIAIRVKSELANNDPRPIKTNHDDGVFQIDSYNFTGEVDVAGKSARFYISPEWEALDAVLRVVLSILLATRGGLLLHASSVGRDGKAFVFAARPEGGKSTIAKMLSEDTVIGDELVAIRRNHENVDVYGTPFWNVGPSGSSKPVCARVRAICILAKDKSASAVRLEPAKAAARTLTHIFYDPENQENSRLTLDALTAVADTVPYYELRFSKDVGNLRRCLDEIG